MKGDHVTQLNGSAYIIREHDEYCGDLECHSCYGAVLHHSCSTDDREAGRDWVCTTCGRLYAWCSPETHWFAKALGSGHWAGER